MGTNVDVVRELVINFQASTVVLSNVNGGLQVGLVRKSVVVSKVESNWESLEAFSTISSVVGQFNGVSLVLVGVVGVTKGHEVLLQISTEESSLVVIWGEGKLTPKSLEVLGVVLEVNTDVVLVFMADVDTFFDQDLLLVVVFTVGMEETLNSACFWCVSVGTCGSFPVTLCWLVFGANFSINVDIRVLKNVILASLESKLLVGKSEVTLTDLSVNADLGFSLS